MFVNCVHVNGFSFLVRVPIVAFQELRQNSAHAEGFLPLLSFFIFDFYNDAWACLFDKQRPLAEIKTSADKYVFGKADRTFSATLFTFSTKMFSCVVFRLLRDTKHHLLSRYRTVIHQFSSLLHHYCFICGSGLKQFNFNFITGSHIYNLSYIPHSIHALRLGKKSYFFDFLTGILTHNDVKGFIPRNNN